MASQLLPLLPLPHSRSVLFVLPAIRRLITYLKNRWQGHDKYLAEAQLHTHTRYCLNRMERHNQELRNEIADYARTKATRLFRAYDTLASQYHDLREDLTIFDLKLYPVGRSFAVTTREYFQLGKNGKEFIAERFAREMADFLAKSWIEHGTFDKIGN